jgi:prophage antirepressor-like protein
LTNSQNGVTIPQEVIMKDLVFLYDDNKVRTALIKEQPYFCATDVGRILGLTNVYRQVQSFKEGVHSVHTPTRGGSQEIIYISEPNLYRLIFKSRKKEAKLFQDWIFEEVIPSIRKTGEYNIPKKLKIESTKNRNMLTDAWADCGIDKPHHFIQLTLQEYKALGLKKGKRKGNMTKKEILLLNALESMEQLKLFEASEMDYYKCRDSLYDTGKLIKPLLNNATQPVAKQ